MAVTRFYLRNSRTNPGTGGAVYDIAENAGPSTTLVSAAVSGTGFVEVFRWQTTLGTDLPDVDIPYSVGISAVSQSTIEVRWRIQRLNSSNTVLESSGYSGLHNSAGNKTGTLSFAAAWAAGDRAALSLEIRRTGGGGSRTVTIEVDRIPPFLETFDFESSGIGSGGGTTATMTFNTNGSLVVTGDGSIGNFGAPDSAQQWALNETGIGSFYEVRVTPTTGTFSSGTTGTWLALSSARTYERTNAGSGDVTFTIEIRPNGGSVIATSTGNRIRAYYDDIGGG
jgi:hypothetical protein